MNLCASFPNRCDSRSDAGRGVLDGNGLARLDSEATHALQIWFWVRLSGSALLTGDEMCEPFLDFQDAERVVHLSRRSVCHDRVADPACIERVQEGEEAGERLQLRMRKLLKRPEGKPQGENDD
jgi:hypothetical protein